MSLPALLTIETERGAIAYRRAGDGPPLVCLHGIGSGSASWAAQLEALAARFDVIAWDTPGYGGSAPLGAARRCLFGVNFGATSRISTRIDSFTLLPRMPPQK